MYAIKYKKYLLKIIINISLKLYFFAETLLKKIFFLSKLSDIFRDSFLNAKA